MRVLITGGSGFFGQSFTRRLLSDGLASKVCIFSRSEFAQAQMRKALNDDERMRWFIGDVRDQQRLLRAMKGVDVVVHAAALKRIEVGFYNPDEMVKTNVLGSMNVIEASIDAKVGRVVFLSTDKAFQPVSAYGQSKALAETLFLAATALAGGHGTRFAVTRYGNVSGSTGSVIPLWRQIMKSGVSIVPVTDPECTRFFMTEAEAVDLVLSTIHNMPAEVVIPELPAYRLADLAKAMDATMQLTGLPAWEKKHESMHETLCSETAPRMSVEQIREALNHV